MIMIAGDDGTREGETTSIPRRGLGGYKRRTEDRPIVPADGRIQQKSGEQCSPFSSLFVGVGVCDPPESAQCCTVDEWDARRPV